ncbi:MAG: MATE family efflux transporter [Lachnospiraceae bacterium]|nr:MATE family efflux transporter [Lachnospiraceae bacterium]
MAENRKEIIKDLTVGSVPKQLLTFAAPLIASGFLQTFYNMVDMLVVGHWVGTNGLAAVAIGGDVLHFLMFIALGMASAGQIIISQFIGAKLYEKVSHMIGTLFTFILSAAVVMTLVCFLLRYQILNFLNTPAEAFDYAYSYAVTCIFGLIFIYGYNLVSAILRGMGDSRHPFVFIAIASVLNIILDLLFVAVFHMGPFGAALATVIGQSVSFLCALGVLYRRRQELGFDFKWKSFGLKMDVFPSLIKLGIPLSIQSAAISLSMLFISRWINAYGAVHTTLYGVSRKIESVLNTVSQALSTSGGSMNGQCIGAEKYDRVPKVMWTIALFGSVIAIVMSIVTISAPEVLFGLFSDDAEVLGLCGIFVIPIVLNYLGAVLRPVMFSLINGSGNARLNLAVALLDGIIVRIGLAYWLGKTHGVIGYWYGAALAGLMPFVIGIIYYWSGKWRTNKYLIKNR